MSRHIRTSRRLIFLCFILIAVSGLSIGTIVRSRTGGTIQEPAAFQISNETRSLQVVGVERGLGEITLTLRNGYSKQITGFQVRLGNVTVQSEFLGTDEVFPPGTIYKNTYPIQEGMETKGVVILAVVLEDGSSDGNKKYIKQIKDKRAGEAEQIRRAILLIEKFEQRPDGTTPERLDTLKAELLTLDVEGGRSISDDYSLGLHDRKSSLVQQIDRLKSSHRTSQQLDLKHELSKIKLHHKKFLAKL